MSTVDGQGLLPDLLPDNHVLRVFHDAQAPTTPTIAPYLPSLPISRCMQEIPPASCRTQRIYSILLPHLPCRPWLPCCALILAVGAPGICDGDSKVRCTRTVEAPIHAVCYCLMVSRSCRGQLAACGSTWVELLSTLAHIPVMNLLRTLCEPCRWPPHRLRT